MLQVKDPQEVFDEHIRPLFVQAAKDIRQKLDEEDLNTPYSIFVLGEMYGTISTCLAQGIPIPEELWNMPVIQSMVRGNVDGVVVVEPDHKEQGFYQSQVDDPFDEAINNTTEEQFDKLAEMAREDIAHTKGSPAKLLDGRGFYIP